jgi:cellulose synthase/poly-beta-1,6-N-acetylglucosamine synthase-like glycosyltransferase
MRRHTSSLGTYVARDILELRKGTFQSKYVQLFVGFIVSAIIHAGVAMLCSKSLNDDASLYFFTVQAVVIMFEDHVIALGRYLSLQESPFWHMIGFLWTITAIGFTCRTWVACLIDNGAWVHARKQGSFLQEFFIQAMK